jgi:uncharacterized SAM-binding protein YcdF (DUF218 family)
LLFILRKLIESLLMPVGLASFLVLAGLAFRRRFLALAGVLILLVLSIPVASHLLMRPLENTYPPKAAATAPQADAIVALSGGVVKVVSPIGTEWGEGANRYFMAYNLAMAGKARWLVFTAATNDPAAPSEGALMREEAIRGGVKPESILLTGRVLTTEDEARDVSQMPGIHSILLVTSAIHMPRAVLLFRARGLVVSPFPTDQKTMSPGSVALDSIPTAHGLRDSEEAMREYYGLAVYKTLLLFHPLGKLRQ